MFVGAPDFLTVSHERRRKPVGLRACTANPWPSRRLIVRNSAALMLVGLLAKGMGLVLAVLIARFLGPTRHGPVRDPLQHRAADRVHRAARPAGRADPRRRRAPARARAALEAGIDAGVRGQPACRRRPSSSRPTSSRGPEPVRNSLLALAVGMPCSAMALVGQSVLQGMEKVLYITWTTFLTRVASLVRARADADGRHGRRIGLHLARAVPGEHGGAFRLDDPARPAGATADDCTRESTFARTLPFAVNRVLTESTTRAPLLLLPILFTLADIGIFDAADRIRLTLGIMVAVATTAIMPALRARFRRPERGPARAGVVQRQVRLRDPFLAQRSASASSPTSWYGSCTARSSPTPHCCSRF